MIPARFAHCQQTIVRGPRHPWARQFKSFRPNVTR
jgi:hypothetical protein